MPVRIQTLDKLQIAHFRKQLHTCELHVISIIIKNVTHAKCKLLISGKSNMFVCNAVIIMPEVHRVHM